jgi:hypothetical protein
MESLMKTLYITIVLLLSASYTYSQCADSVIPYKNYKLYDYYTGKEKNFLAPKNAKILLNKADTIISFDGRVISLLNNEVKLEYLSKEINLNYSKNNGSTYQYFNACKNISIPFDKIEYIEHSTKFSNTVAIIAGAAAFYGLFLAPLSGIPGEDEKGFIGKRYVNSLSVAAGVFAVSYTLYITFPKTKRYRISPKME